MSPSTNNNTNTTSKMSAATTFFRFGFRGKAKAAAKQQQQQQAIAQATHAPAPAPVMPARRTNTRKPSLRVRTQSIAHPRPSAAMTNAPARSGWFSDGDDLDDEDDEDEDATDAIDDFFGVSRSRADRRDRREGTAALLPKAKAATPKGSSNNRPSRISIAAPGRPQAFRALASPSASSSVTGSPASSLYLASPRSSTSSRTSRSSSSVDVGCTNAIDDFFSVSHRRGNLNGHRDERWAKREYQVSAATASMLSPGAVTHDRRFSSFVVAKPAYK